MPLARRFLRTAALAVVFLPLLSRAQSNDAALNTSFATHETPAPGSDVAGVRAIAVQADGKVVVGGDFSDNFFANQIAGHQSKLTRLLPAGHYDPSFKFTQASNPVEAIVVLGDGRLLIGGAFDSLGVVQRDGIARLGTDGSVDAAFGPAGSYTRPGSLIDIHAIVVQPDGKVLIGGAFRTTLSDGSTRDNLMRLTADGVADPTFSVGSDAGVGIVRGLSIQPDGKIVAGGNAGRMLARYDPDGSVDATFVAHVFNGASFGDPTQTIASVVLQTDGKVLTGGRFVAGDLAASRASLVRFNADGSLDLGFDAKIDVTTSVLAVALQPDGRIVVGGAFSSFSGASRTGVVRVNADGGIDATFDPGVGATLDGGSPATISALALPAGGGTFIGGNLVSYQGQPRVGIARLGTGTLPPPPAVLADLSGTLTGLKTGVNGSGSKFKVSGKLTVNNTGSVTAKKVEVAAYLSDDATFDAAKDRLIGLVSLAEEGFPKVKAGKSVTLTVKFKGKASELGPTSGKNLLMVLDPRGAIEESDESNNVVLSEALP